MIFRGDVYDADFPIAGIRPAVVVTREEALFVLSSVTLVGITGTARGHVAEVELDERDGLDRPSVANCDEVYTVPKSLLGRYRGHLGLERLRQLDDALRLALGLERA